MRRLAVLIPLTLLVHTTTSQTSSDSKRGIAYLGTSHPSDYTIFTTGSTPLNWYYNWSPYPVSSPSSFSHLEFVPLLHNLDSLRADLSQLSNLPSTSTHLLTFNEPDHSTDGGGTDISPPDAAQAYIDQIAPLSIQNGGSFHISHPSTTGTLSGLNWLQRFNDSCFSLNSTHGCVSDFIATHFYGDFPAMASWLGTLNEWYNTNGSSSPGRNGNLGIWITELALPQMSAQATQTMMNTTLPFLDGLDYVEKYAWFGIFRQRNANEWTGDGVALLDNDGDLTDLGATYMGGSYRAGMRAEEQNTAVMSRGGLGLLLVGAVSLSLVSVVGSLL